MPPTSFDIGFSPNPCPRKPGAPQYDLMDAAYDAEPIRQHSRSLGHVPLIDTNPRRDKTLAEELRTEARRLQCAFR